MTSPGILTAVDSCNLTKQRTCHGFGSPEQLFCYAPLIRSAAGHNTPINARESLSSICSGPQTGSIGCPRTIVSLDVAGTYRVIANWCLLRMKLLLNCAVFEVSHPALGFVGRVLPL